MSATGIGNHKPSAVAAGEPPSGRRLGTLWFGWLAVMAIQTLLAALGLLAVGSDFIASPVWPAAGFAVAVTILYGYGVLPAVAAGSALASLAVDGTSLPLALWLGCAGAMGAGTGAYLVHRWVPRFGQPDADSGEVLRFQLATAVVGTAVAALLGATGITVGGDAPPALFGNTLLTWWLGDLTGVMTVAPFVLTWLQPHRRREALQRPRELLVFVAVTALVVATAFGLYAQLSVVASHIRPDFAVVPLLVWGALRFGLLGAATGGILVTAVATIATLGGAGPYAGGSLADMHALQFMVAVAMATALLLGITTTRKHYLHRQAADEAAFVRSIADNLPGAVFRRHMTPDGKVTYPYMAGQFAREFGLDWVGEAGEHDSAKEQSLELTGPELERLRRSAAEMEPFETELRFVHDDGSVGWARSMSRPHCEAGGVTWDGILLDVTREKEQHTRVEYLAHHDPLTGLLNRAGLHDLLEPALSRARRQDQFVALWLLDLDGFKGINDRYGHSVGDDLLKVAADRIRETMRVEDIKARLGGDEFVVVQTDVRDAAGVDAVCQRLAARLREPVELDDLTLRMSASIGIALFPTDGTTSDGLFIAADHAMYEAKARDNTPVFYSAKMGSDARERSDLTQALAAAIAQRKITVQYQPQVDMPSGEIIGCEALARWWHPGRGWIAPDRFVPLAEEKGLISGLDGVVFEQVLADQAAWQSERGLDLPVAVNLSGASLRDASNRDRLVSSLRASGIAPSRLELEFTESTLVHASDERVGQALCSLAALGVRLSADDFGTGYGSLTYLRSLPITRIKIDRSFVEGAPVCSGDREIVRALLQLARNLGLQVVAEGVATASQEATLKELGCRYAQGYYFARPMSGNHLLAFIAQREVPDSAGRAAPKPAYII